MTTGARFRIEPLPEARFGAQVTGADLAALGDAEFTHIAGALANHVLLVFRGQETLRPEDQIAFSLRFGPLLPPQLREYTLDGFPSIGILSNDKKEDGTPVGLPSSGRNWHTDVQFDRTPPDATFLVSRILPDEGGDTLFANMFLALEALSAERRTRIENLRVVHSRVRSWPILFPDRPPLPQNEAARYPDVSHPLVRTHPVNGRKALYVGGNMAMGIEGMDDTKAMALIKELRDFAIRDEFVVRLRWRSGDAALWDNRCAMHCATAYAEERYRRVMHRTSFAPAVPV